MFVAELPEFMIVQVYADDSIASMALLAQDRPRVAAIADAVQASGTAPFYLLRLQG
jgi:hypothetical protein